LQWTFCKDIAISFFAGKLQHIDPGSPDPEYLWGSAETFERFQRPGRLLLSDRFNIDAESPITAAGFFADHFIKLTANGYPANCPYLENAREPPTDIELTPSW